MTFLWWRSAHIVMRSIFFIAMVFMNGMPSPQKRNIVSWSAVFVVRFVSKRYPSSLTFFSHTFNIRLVPSFSGSMMCFIKPAQIHQKDNSFLSISDDLSKQFHGFICILLRWRNLSVGSEIPNNKLVDRSGKSNNGERNGLSKSRGGICRPTLWHIVLDDKEAHLGVEVVPHTFCLDRWKRRIYHQRWNG